MSWSGAAGATAGSSRWTAGKCPDTASWGGWAAGSCAESFPYGPGPLRAGSTGASHACSSIMRLYRLRPASLAVFMQHAYATCFAVLPCLAAHGKGGGHWLHMLAGPVSAVGGHDIEACPQPPHALGTRTSSQEAASRGQSMCAPRLTWTGGLPNIPHLVSQRQALVLAAARMDSRPHLAGKKGGLTLPYSC